MAYCSRCGAKLRENTKFCTSCGEAVIFQEGEKDNYQVEGTNVVSQETIKLEPVNLNSIAKEDLDKAKEFNKVKESNKASGEEEGLTPSVVQDSENSEERNQLSYIEPINNVVIERDNNLKPQFNYERPERNHERPNDEVKSIKGRGVTIRPWQIAILVILIFLGSLAAIFSKPIKGSYYLVRYNGEKNLEKKLQYASDALITWQTSTASSDFKNTAAALIKENDTTVEEKILALKDRLKPGDYKELTSNLYNQKAINSVNAQKYDEAFSALIKLQENGGVSKDNPKYEAIMLNIIAETTGGKVYDSKEELVKDGNTVFDDIDGDNFDEFIEIKDMTPSYYDVKQYDITLYKLVSDKYQAVYTEHREYSEAISGSIHNYEKGKKGFYLETSESGYISACEVYKLQNNKLVSIGAVGSSDPTVVLDFDNDGIFEVKTSTLNDDQGYYSHAEAPRTIDYYKFYDDGAKKPAIVKEEESKAVSPSDNSSDSSTTASNGDYIFPDSATSYLTDDEVSALSKDDMALARNEIFARHGYVFKEKKFVDYFTSKSWYSPDPNYSGGDSVLNDVEIYNYKLILKWENQK